MNKVSQVQVYGRNLIGKWFAAAPVGQGIELKNYTSGDGDNIGFEGISKQILEKAIEVYNLSNRCVINSEYFEDPTGKFDAQRMDNHVWIDGKVVIVEENRAWIDKPFYTLKRAVVQSFMKLSHVRKHLSDDVIFIFTSLARDVTEVTRLTADVVYGSSDRITEFNISGHPRRTKKYNYFDNGYDRDEVDNYIKTICGVFEKYE